MTVRDLSEPDPSSWESPHSGSSPNLDALLLAWSEAIRQEDRADSLLAATRGLENALRQREQVLATLRQAGHVLSATTRAEAVAQLARDLFTGLLSARSCIVWALGEQSFQVKATLDVGRGQAALELPAPNPFPTLPLLLDQWQSVERTDLPAPLPMLLVHLGPLPLYIPLAFHGMLSGFLLMDAAVLPERDGPLADTLELLQRLFGAALFHAWSLRDLQNQRERLREDGAQTSRKLEVLQRENLALTKGQGHRMEFLGFALDQLRPILGQLLATMTRLKQDSGLAPEDRGTLLLEGLLQGKRMAEFLKDLTEMARQGRAAVTATPQPPLPVDLGALLQEIRPMVECLPRPPGSELDWPDLTDLPEILAIRESLQQVLLALCHGACRLNARGDLHLWVEREPLHLAIRLLLEGLEMEPVDPSVHRTGSMPASEYFARGRSGHGLGLVIAEHLVKGMGGNLRLDRDFFGQGAVISLEFPLA